MTGRSPLTTRRELRPWRWPAPWWFLSAVTAGLIFIGLIALLTWGFSSV